MTKTPLQVLGELRDGCRVNPSEREALERVIRLVNRLEMGLNLESDPSDLDLVTVGGVSTVVSHGRQIDMDWPQPAPVPPGYRRIAIVGSMQERIPGYSR